jgi:hypothetical protein
MFRPRRNMVATNRTAGKALNSKGLRINKAVIKIKTELVTEMANKKSSMNGGRGMIRRTTNPTTPTPIKTWPVITPLKKVFRLSCGAFGVVPIPADVSVMD